MGRGEETMKIFDNFIQNSDQKPSQKFSNHQQGWHGNQEKTLNTEFTQFGKRR
jgi:hypothetical protein